MDGCLGLGVGMGVSVNGQEGSHGKREIQMS